MNEDIRTDPYLGTVVHIVADRQKRPNLPTTGCPFCVGGLEAPQPYTTRAFTNRWPALQDDRCEVVLYSPHHDGTLHSIGHDAVSEVIDLWAARTTTLRAKPNGEYIVVFENRGADIGATISHPHGQIYAFDHVPSRPARQLRSRWAPDFDSAERTVLRTENWIVYTEHASVYPVSLRIAPLERTADLPSLSQTHRESLASVLITISRALDDLYHAPLPYMLWCNQSPRTVSDWPDAWLNFEIVSPWRDAHVPRYIAAVEVATEEFFNPVDPADIASQLRALV